jgi:general stress protein YciG
VSSGDDPEKLLAEALRAQAARTVLPEKTEEPPAAKPDEPDEPDEPIAPAEAEEPTEEHSAQVGGYGLFSGGQHLGYTQPEDTEQVDSAGARAGQTTKLRQHGRVGIGVILLLALVLGLAAGAVVGLVTLL